MANLFIIDVSIIFKVQVVNISSLTVDNVNLICIKTEGKVNLLKNTNLCHYYFW